MWLQEEEKEIVASLRLLTAMDRMSWQVVPPGGWQYKQGDLWIKEDSFHQLVVAVTQHRMNNRMPSGNPESDIENQLLKLHPQLELNKVK